MARNGKKRLGLAIIFSILAHFSALALLVPLYALGRAIRILLEPNSDTLRIAAFLAILLHFVLLFPAIHWLLLGDDTGSTSDRYEVSLWNQPIQTEREEEKTPEEELDDYEPDEEVPDGQVVRAPKISELEEPKDKPRFLSEHDATVLQETKARNPTRGSGETSQQVPSQGMGQNQQNLDGGMQSSKPGLAEEQEDRALAENGETSALKRAPPATENINLMPSMEAMAAAISGSGLDHIEDVVEADRTALNTAGWKYASFFNRVKAKVERFWRPDVEYMQHDPYGNIYGFKDRTTVLLVVLRPDGSLKKVYVMDPSGAPFLDQEALDAVRLAAPFPNVPDGLKSKHDNLVKFTFHFIVQVGAQPIFRMRRYNP